MKKVVALLSLIAVMSLAGVANAETSLEAVHQNHDEGIHLASSGTVVWQCRVCGHRTYLRRGTMPAMYGCNMDFSKAHIWERIG